MYALLEIYGIVENGTLGLNGEIVCIAQTKTRITERLKTYSKMAVIDGYKRENSDKNSIMFANNYGEKLLYLIEELD